MTSDITIEAGHRVVVTPDRAQGVVWLTILPPDGGYALRVPFTINEADDHAIIFDNACDELLPGVVA